MTVLLTLICSFFIFSLCQSRCALQSSHLTDDCSLCVRWTVVDECWVVGIDQSSGGWQSLAFLHRSFCSIQLKLVLCRSGHCWVLIPPSNIRDIDFFTGGCFCLHKYWIDFKQRGSSICPRVNVSSFFFLERNISVKNRTVLVVLFCVCGRARQY